MARRRRRQEEYSQHGFEPSHGRVAVTHWSQACLDVVARQAAAAPLRRWFGALVTGGFSAAWHLLMCRERRSLRIQRQYLELTVYEEWSRTFGRTGHRSVGTCTADRRCLPAGEAISARVHRDGAGQGGAGRGAGPIGDGAWRAPHRPGTAQLLPLTGAHVARDVLRARERRLADGALVISSHRVCRGRQRRARGKRR
jgi:hypothetical protein